MKNLIKFIINKEFYIFAFAIPSLIVGWLGLNRPYYSTPDQDFLWVSQSIRLLQGLGPSYADHPGAYWPVSFLIKFVIFSRSFFLEFIDKYGAVSEELIDKIIHISRIENSLITAGLPLLFFLILKELEVDKRIIILTTYILCLSAANLILASDIRHENIGIFFMFFYLLLTSKELNKSINLYFLNLNAIRNTLFFYASIFCKQQILLISPLIFLFILNCLKIKNLEYYKKLKEFIKRKNISTILLLFFLSGIPWIIISIEEFFKFGFLYLINLPFWSFINTGLIFSMMISGKEQLKKSVFLKYLFVLTTMQILVFEIIAPNVWRRSITAFPSFLFQFSSFSDGNLNLYTLIKDFIMFIKESFASISWPDNLVFIVAFLLIIYFIKKLLVLIINKRDFSLFDYSVSSLLILIIILSFRKQIFYQIYFFIPILILLSLGFRNIFLEKYNINERFKINNFLFLTSSILLISFSIKSTINIFNLNKFVSTTQSQELLCDSQNLDFSLKNKPVPNCEEFEKECYKKTNLILGVKKILEVIAWVYFCHIFSLLKRVV